MKKRFYLDKANGRIFGVCSGIARHMGWDPTFVRVGVVLITLLGAFPWTLIAYGAAAMIAKNRPLGGYDEEAPVRRGADVDLRAQPLDARHRPPHGRGRDLCDRAEYRPRPRDREPALRRKDRRDGRK